MNRGVFLDIQYRSVRAHLLMKLIRSGSHGTGKKNNSFRSAASSSFTNPSQNMLLINLSF